MELDPLIAYVQHSFLKSDLYLRVIPNFVSKISFCLYQHVQREDISQDLPLDKRNSFRGAYFSILAEEASLSASVSLSKGQVTSINRTRLSSSTTTSGCKRRFDSWLVRSVVTLPKRMTFNRRETIASCRSRI